VRLSTGVYTLDPVFAAFVRQSLALGYRPAVYDFVTAQGSPRTIAQREQGEADNLMSGIFSKTPKAKVLIYVGYVHAAERPLEGNTWMKRMTGIDPLTIDETTLSPTGSGGLYAALERRMRGRSVVPRLGGKPLKFGSLGPAVDLQVAHPPTRLVRGRPDWLFAMGRTAVAVPLRLRPRTGRVLVQAFLASEAADAIPVDQVIARAGEKPPPLLVPPGPLRFVLRRGFELGDYQAARKRGIVVMGLSHPKPTD
jgi:hypothetical protein